VPLPSGYSLRHPEPGEAPAIQTVLDACEAADTGEPRRHDTDVANEWLNPRSRPDEDWWVAVAPDGGLAAAGWVWRQTPAETTADHYVHPDHRGRGLGDAMLDAIEARAGELPGPPNGVPRSLVVWCEDKDIVRRASLDQRGFRPIRQYFEMAAGLAGDLETPVWPAGIVARGCRQGFDEEVVYRADQEAFAEHHLFEPRPYDEWRLSHLDRSDSDPSLWWLAWDGDELAGFALPFLGAGGAVIGDLAVRRPWRGRGIGHALLLAAFRTLRERGQARVRLYVDAQNVTDAVPVYLAAGMQVSRRFDVLEKPLA
jgi:mycothiol synthase